MAPSDRDAGVASAGGLGRLAQRPSVSPTRQAWRRFRRKKTAMAAALVIAVIYGAGVFAPWVAPYDYADQNLREVSQDPSWEHWLGTDHLGRDMLSRLIWGARTTVIVTVAATVTGAIVLGVGLGLVAGYFGGRVDNVIMRLAEIAAAFPDIFLVIMIVATIRPRIIDWVRSFEAASGIEGIVRSGIVDYLIVFGALSLFSWVGMARLVRGQILSLKETEFVEAARAIGATPWRIMLRHLLPNSIAPIIVTVSMGMAGLAGSEVILSWLGIGIQPPNPSWGVMIFENQSIRLLISHPHRLLAPATTLFLVVLSWNLLGDGLNDALNPRAR